MGYKVTKIGQSASVRVNTGGLDNLLLGIKQKYAARVGILGSTTRVDQQRKEPGEKAKGGGHKVGKEASEMTNAEIGLAHEKGIKSKNLPRRSWLETPLRENLGSYFKELGVKAIETILKNQPKEAYRDLGIIAEQIIQRGFETGGYGKWKQLSQVTIRKKGSSAILIDTAQLRRSITSTVVST